MKKLVERTRPNANDRVNILKIFIEGLERQGILFWLCLCLRVVLN
jgi:hypothetical protein